MMGHALSSGEKQEVISAISVFLADVNGNVVAALSLTGSTTRIMDENLYEKVEAVKKYARMISKKVGFTAELQ